MTSWRRSASPHSGLDQYVDTTVRRPSDIIRSEQLQRQIRCKRWYDNAEDLPLYVTKLQLR